jgi:hypothetical protein
LDQKSNPSFFDWVFTVLLQYYQLLRYKQTNVLYELFSVSLFSLRVVPVSRVLLRRNGENVGRRRRLMNDIQNLGGKSEGRKKATAAALTDARFPLSLLRRPLNLILRLLSKRQEA